ncbi:hypothetical protein M3Y97_00780200 [Aphelenchoides bicaudatus]|nr:hypothetical protein M3Y97_00780200 [Aphelenchoides bicaudatus]
MTIGGTSASDADFIYGLPPGQSTNDTVPTQMPPIQPMHHSCSTDSHAWPWICVTVIVALVFIGFLVNVLINKKPVSTAIGESIEQLTDLLKQYLSGKKPQAMNGNEHTETV